MAFGVSDMVVGCCLFSVMWWVYSRRMVGCAIVSGLIKRWALLAERCVFLQMMGMNATVQC